MAFRYTGKAPDTFGEAARRHGLLPTVRTRSRDVLLLARRLWLVRVWGMDIHPFTLISLKAVLDRTHPQGIHVGEGSAISFGAVVLTHDHVAGRHTHTRIGRYCQVGAYSMVMPGVVVGDHSIVAAGAIVTRDVPPRTIVAGNPARVIRTGIATTNWGRLTDRGEKPAAA